MPSYPQPYRPTSIPLLMMHAGTSANTAQRGKPTQPICNHEAFNPTSVKRMATNLLLSIAWTHVSTRVRQTLVGMFGVAMGVGFTIMMAGLMQGSQIDFLRQLVDTMPHVTVEDERRSVPSQPAEEEYAAVGISNVPNVNRRPGIKYADATMTSLRSWLPGDVAPSVKTTAIVNHGEARVGVGLVGI